MPLLNAFFGLKPFCRVKESKITTWRAAVDFKMPLKYCDQSAADKKIYEQTWLTGPGLQERRSSSD